MNYEGNNNLIIVALSIGMGVIPIAVPTFYEHFPSWFQTVFDSGISSAAVTAVLLNLLFNVSRRGDSDGGGDSSPSRRPSASRPNYDVPGGRDRARQPSTSVRPSRHADRSRRPRSPEPLPARPPGSRRHP